MYIFDAWALVAWFGDEAPAADTVEAILNSHGPDDLQIHRNNVAEILYLALRRSDRRATEVAEAIRALPIRVVDSPDPLLWRAARIKADHSFGFADSFAAATALEYDAQLVTGDRDFELLEQSEGLEVKWLG